MGLKHLMQRITSTNGIDIQDSAHVRVPAGEIRAALAEIAAQPPERPLYPFNVPLDHFEDERWKRIAENAQAVTTGGDDRGDYFEVPAHLMAALALALDEWPGARDSVTSGELFTGDDLAVQLVLADAPRPLYPFKVDLGEAVHKLKAEVDVMRWRPRP